MERAENRTGTVRLVDTETGEIIGTSYTYKGEEAARNLKGWMLRTRTAYKRRTGRTLRIEREQA